LLSKNNFVQKTSKSDDDQ